MTPQVCLEPVLSASNATGQGPQNKELCRVYKDAVREARACDISEGNVDTIGEERALLISALRAAQCQTQHGCNEETQ